MKNKMDYMLLGRLKADCNYYLDFGERNTKRLYFHDGVEQIAKMKEIYNSFPPNEKPEWITMNEILKFEEKMCFSTFQTRPVKSRVEVLADKIRLKENLYCLEKMPEWIEQSKGYAKKMKEKKLVTITNEKELRLMFLLNKLCPNLHHFKKMPFGNESIETYNRQISEHTMENSQAEFVDRNGLVLQRGVLRTGAEFDKFIKIVEQYIAEEKNTF